jgi:hypothetical protein
MKVLLLGTFLVSFLANKNVEASIVSTPEEMGDILYSFEESQTVDDSDEIKIQRSDPNATVDDADYVDPDDVTDLGPINDDDISGEYETSIAGLMAVVSGTVVAPSAGYNVPTKGPTKRPTAGYVFTVPTLAMADDGFLAIYQVGVLSKLAEVKAIRKTMPIYASGSGGKVFSFRAA